MDYFQNKRNHHRLGSLRGMLSAGTASASSEAKNASCGVFGLALFPQESPPCAHPDY